ncbi:MAG: hypothetical protein ACFE7R_05190 [Candidatus Hodarchaeota archaeon]
MTNECLDKTCKEKIQAIDKAIQPESMRWSVILQSTENLKEVDNALRFCKVFGLDAKVKVKPDGYEVLARDETIDLL